MMRENKKNNYYWKSLRNYYKQYVIECPTCLKLKQKHILLINDNEWNSLMQEPKEYKEKKEKKHKNKNDKKSHKVRKEKK